MSIAPERWSNDFGLKPRELRTLRALSTPERIQRALDDDIGYNLEPDGPTARSVRRVLRDRVAHCLEGALLAAAALRLQGHAPRLVDLEAVRDDDHVLAVFQEGGRWGAIAKSNYSGLRFREPVYRSIHELVMSYFEHYYNLAREKTLRRYSLPVDLSRLDHLGWMTSEDELWPVGHALMRAPHRRVLTDAQIGRLRRVDRRLFLAGRLGAAH